jgi:bacterioferritin
MSPEAYAAEAVQQAIVQGAITEAYQADPQQVIQALNRLRATEVTSDLQYKQHADMAVSLCAPGLKDDFEAHATLELQHADRLAQRIQQLGGVPLYSPVDIAAQAASVGVRPEQGPTLREMIIENLILERQQVAAYTTLVRALGEGDPTTRRLLLETLADTERHASELADYLKGSCWIPGSWMCRWRTTRLWSCSLP